MNFIGTNNKLSFITQLENDPVRAGKAVPTGLCDGSIKDPWLSWGFSISSKSIVKRSPSSLSGSLVHRRSKFPVRKERRVDLNMQLPDLLVLAAFVAHWSTNHAW